MLSIQAIHALSRYVPQFVNFDIGLHTYLFRLVNAVTGDKCAVAGFKIFDKPLAAATEKPGVT